MEKHPQITIDRIRLVIDELKGQLWLDRTPLAVSVYQCAEPIPYQEAIAQTYTPVEPGYCWGPIWSTAWFRVQGTLPDAWAGETVALLMDTSTEALVWEEGAPAQGLDVNRQDFLLTQSTGEVDYFVEAAGNNLFGSRTAGEARGPKGMADTPFVLKYAEVARLNVPAWDLYHDLRILFDLALQLPEREARRERLLYACNEAVNAYRHGDFATARAALAPEYACPATASAPLVNAIGHSHIDTAWLWPLRETIRKCSRTFASVLKYQARYPEYRFMQSQPQLYAFVQEHYPALYARIKAAVAKGRWEPQGAMWVEADCNITGGESLVRQLLYGMKFFREEFGVTCNTLWLPDVFGYSAALPQILQGFGIPYFVTAKINWNAFNTFPHNTFHWEGIDGTQVLAHFLPSGDYNGNPTPAQVRKYDSNYKDHDRANTWLYPYGYGDGGGGVTPDMLEALRRMENLEGLPRIERNFVCDWLPRMADEARDLRTWVGELYLELHRGTYTTQAHTKRNNRKSEFLLRDAEFFAAIHPGGTQDYPAAALEGAWRKVLTNQFHDIIPGSSITWVYQDAERDYAAARTTAEGIIDAEMANFAAQIDTGNLACPITVWNTLSFPRSGVVSLPWDGPEAMVVVTAKGVHTRTQVTEEDGERRLLVEVVDTPSMGYTTLDLQEGVMPDDVAPAVTDEATASDRALENELVRIEFNDHGEVISYYDKSLEREIIAPVARGNVFQLFDDHPNNWDAWEIDPSFEEVGGEVTTPAQISVVEAGPLRATLRVQRQLGAGSHLVQDIHLEANTRRLDFDTRIEWHESHQLLKVAFPVDVHSPRATYEIQYGHVERPTHRNTSWDMARFEVPAQKWADLSESDYGVALLNDCKYGYDIHGNVMRLSLLRAPKSPDPEADMGAHQFTYSLLPHRGEVASSGVPLAGYDVNVPLRVQRLPVQEGALAQTHSYFRLDKQTLIIESVKRAEDGRGIIVRLYEAFRRRGSVRLLVNGMASRAWRCDLREGDLIELPVQGGAVQFDYHPFEIVTLRLE